MLPPDRFSKDRIQANHQRSAFLEQASIPDPDISFDELVWFTLTGIARRRGEVLPTQLP